MVEEIEEQSVNGLVTDEEWQSLQDKYEEKHQLVKILTSQNIDDLKGMSEIPRRLIFAFSMVDVVIEAREELHELLFEEATKNYNDAIEMLTDDNPDNDHKANLKLKKAERKMQLAIVHKGKTSRLLKRFRLSVLQYMQGVDRKGRAEILEAFAAIASVDEGEEIEAK